MIHIGTENFVLISAVLIFAAVFAGKLAYRLGAPALLLFLGVGILGGYKFIAFYSVGMTQFIGMIALCIILFTGGMETKFAQIRPVMGPGVVLATAGVALTALLMGGFVALVSPWLGLPLSFPMAMLLASTMASTDSASVFSILRSKKQGLKENLRPMLELESGSNDPVAYMLTVLMVGVVAGGEASVWSGLLRFVVEMGMGIFVGFLIGRAAVWVINTVEIYNDSLYPILLLAFAFFTFAFTSILRGNGYLAVYVAGLIVGNLKLAHKHNMTNFFDGFTWLLQIVLFVTLGLLVNIDELLQPEVLLLGGLVGLFMIGVGRPAAVFLCLLPFRKFSRRARLYVSWVGLRGAVPIIFATYPLAAHIEGASLIFNVVYMGTIVSLLVQGTTVSGMANLLGLAYEERESSFNVSIHDDLALDLDEVVVTQAMLANGNTLNKIVLPEQRLVMMVCREGNYFVPNGHTSLSEGDKLLIISGRDVAWQDAYRNAGIEDVIKLS